MFRCCQQTLYHIQSPLCPPLPPLSITTSGSHWNHIITPKVSKFYMKCFNIGHVVSLSVHDLKIFSSGKFLVLFLEMSFYFLFIFLLFLLLLKLLFVGCWRFGVVPLIFLSFFILPSLHIFVLFPEVSSSSATEF